jgi:hypothetical protein
MARNDETVTAPGVPGARPKIVERAHDPGPAVEDQDRDAARTGVTHDRYRATPMLDRIRHEVVERLHEAHRIALDNGCPSSPVERDAPSHGNGRVPRLHDSIRDLPQIDELGPLNDSCRECATGDLQVASNRYRALVTVSHGLDAPPVRRAWEPLDPRQRQADRGQCTSQLVRGECNVAEATHKTAHPEALHRRGAEDRAWRKQRKRLEHQPERSVSR